MPAAAVAALLDTASLAQVLPTGATVTHGQATIATQGGTMTVTNSRNAAIDWQTFSIGSGQTVHFQQPDAHSNVLNRVVGAAPSTILGRLSSNGGVWLLNPHGILFGADSRIDVAQLVAATLRLDLDDWRRGRVTLERDPSAAGSVRNEGRIAVDAGGRVVLAGADVGNAGTIDAPGGSILMLGGRTIVLDSSASPGASPSAAATSPGGRVTNTGELRAEGGFIGMQAAAVNHSGIARAVSLRQGAGGTIELRGAEVTVGDGAVLDASGVQGGGSVGVNGERAQAERSDAPAGVYVARTATLRADALDAGAGGRVVVRGEDAARIYGNFSVDGGPRGGDGGFVDTSGGWLDLRTASMRLGATAGRPGLWLIDPYDITIVAAAPNVPIQSPSFSAGSDSTVIGAAQIASALSSGDVTINTGSSGTQPGNIEMTRVQLLVQSFSPRTLTFEAAGNIDLNFATIASTAVTNGTQPLNIRLHAGQGGSGGIGLNGASLRANGGAIDLQGASLRTASFVTTDGPVATSISGATVQMQGDSVTLGATTIVTATGGGTPLQIQGRTGTSLTSFVNTAGANVLATPGGRWQIAADTPTATTLGGLVPDFRQYGASPTATPAQPTGNALLYANTPVLDVTATANPLVTRPYDGSTIAPQPAAPITLTPLAQADERLQTTPTFAVAYASPGIGDAVPLVATLPNGLPPIVAGPNNAPVYGYTFRGAGLTGRITPPPPTYELPPGGLPGDRPPIVTTNPVVDVLPDPMTVLGAGTGRGLRSRDALNDWLLEPIADKLRADPTLANLPDCPSAAAAAAGTCLLTAVQRAEYARLFNLPSQFTLLASILWPMPTTITGARFTSGEWVSAGPFGELAWASGPPGGTTSPLAGAPAVAPLPDGTVVRSRGLAADTASSTAPSSDSANADTPDSVAANEVCAYDQARRQWDCLTRVSDPQIRRRLQNLPTCPEWRLAIDGTCRLDAQRLTEVRQHVEARAPWSAAQVATLRPALPEIKRKHALLVGIGSYPPPMTLPSVASDLGKLCRKLNDDFGYSVKVLLNPSRPQIVAALNLLYADMNEGDSALVQFAGHGFLTERDGYWITGDTVRRRPDGRVDVEPASVITNSDIVRWMKGFEARQVILLADSSFHDAQRRSVTLKPPSDVRSLLQRPSALAWTSNRNEPLSDHRASVFTEGLLASLDAVGNEWDLGVNVTRSMARTYLARGMPMTPRYVPVTLDAGGEVDASSDYVFERRRGAVQAGDAACVPGGMPLLRLTDRRGLP